MSTAQVRNSTASRLGAARLVAAAVLGALAGLTAIIATRSGIGISPDSIEYLDIAAGRASVPRLPPAYPVLLRAVSPRVVNAIAFAGTVAGISAVAGIPAGIFALTSTDLAVVHAMAWSEALFLALMTVFLWSLSRNQTAASATLASIMSLTRLAGVAALPTLFITTWRASGPRRALVATAAASVPFLVFSVATRGAGRSIAWHPPGYPAMTSAAVALMGWVTPPSAPAAMYVIGPTLAIAVLVLAWTNRTRWPPIVRVSAAWCVAYVIVVVFARAFVDALIPFDARMLAPLFIGALIAIGAGTAATERPTGAKAVIVAAVFVGWIAVRGTDAVGFARRAGRDGLGFASREWQQSAIANEIRGLPASAVIFSNAADGLAYATGRTIQFVPSVRDPLTRLPVTDSAGIGRRFVDLVDQKGAYVVYVRDVARWRQYVLPESTFSRTLGRPPRLLSDSGAIYH